MQAKSRGRERLSAAVARWLTLGRGRFHERYVATVRYARRCFWTTRSSASPVSVRRNRRNILVDTLAPDWVCEVLSSSTRKVDLHEKRPIYACEGVSHLWLVDPIDHALEAFELHDGQWLLIASVKDDEPVSIRPFDAISFSLGDLWP